MTDIFIKELGETVRFPDGMSQEEMEPHLKNYYKMRTQAAKETGAWESALIGAGRTTDKFIAGTKDIFYGLTGNEEAQARIAEEQAEKDYLYRPLQQEHPVATTLGETAPYLMPIPGLKAVKGAKLLNTGKAAVTGALYGGAHYDQSALSGAAWGGGVSGGLNLVGKAGKPVADVSKKLGKQGTRLLNKANELGIKLTPGQITDSKVLKSTERAIVNNPVTGPAFSKVQEFNQKVFNRIAAKAIGLGDDVVELTEDMIDQAYETLSKKFQQFGKGVAVRLDDEFLTKLDDLQKKYYGTVIKGEKGSKIIDDFIDWAAKNKGVVDGSQARLEASALGRSATAAMRSGDASTGLVMFGIQNTLDDLIVKSAKGNAKLTLMGIKSQYKNYQNLLKGGALDSATGNVSPAKLANVLKRKTGDITGYVRGKNKSDFYEMARIGKRFPPPGGGSDTAYKLATMGTGGAIGATLWPLVTAGNPVPLLTAGGLYGAGRAGSAAYLSPWMRQYLQQGNFLQNAANPLLSQYAGRAAISPINPFNQAGM